MIEGGHAAVQADEDVVGAAQVRDLEKRVRDLDRMLGKKTMEAEILKEAFEPARPKKRTSPMLSWTNPETIPDERQQAIQASRTFSEARGCFPSCRTAFDHRSAPHLWL